MQVTQAPVQPIREAQARRQGRFAGQVRRLRIQPESAVPTLELELTDGSGRLTVRFMGRSAIPGVECGASITVEGTPADADDGLVIYNPAYDLR